MFDPTKIPNFRLSDDERALKFIVGKRQFECTLATYACIVTDTAKKYRVRARPGYRPRSY